MNFGSTFKKLVDARSSDKDWYVPGTFTKYNIDPTQEPILVYPTQHYQNGGLAINTRAQSSVPGLYAAGEVSGGNIGVEAESGSSVTELPRCYLFL